VCTAAEDVVITCMVVRARRAPEVLRQVLQYHTLLIMVNATKEPQLVILWVSAATLASTLPPLDCIQKVASCTVSVLSKHGCRVISAHNALYCWDMAGNCSSQLSDWLQVM
jgi:hypothetical protein